MRGTTDSNVVRSEGAEQDAAPLSDINALTPSWLDRLVRGVDEVPDEQDADFSLQHVQGPPATVARIHGAIGRAVAAMDTSMERDACWKLAQHLIAQDFDLGAAVRFARRSVALEGTDPQRRQLAALLESVGGLEAAAELLGSMVGSAPSARDAARLLAAQASLRTRAGHGQAALDLLLQASAVWPGSAEALDTAAELAAALGMTEAVSMLLEAADRHEARGDKAGAFDARRRAFELGPGAAQTADALLVALDKTSRWDAADAVLRSHADANQGEQRLEAHRRRFVRAMERGQASTALAAICDGRLEAEVDDAAGAAVDELLETVGLHDLLAARQLVRARSQSDPARAAAWTALVGLYMGRLASPDRALDAWIEVLAADPSNAQALAALRAHARTMHDPTALAEALLRAASTADDAVAIERFRELAEVAEERLADPSLAHWAYEQMAARGAAGEQLNAARQRLVPRVRLQDGALSSARDTLASSPSPEGRIEALRRAAAILRGRPADVGEYLDTLRQLVESGQGERRWWVDFERVARRTGQLGLLESLVRSRLDARASRAEQVHYRMLLAEACIARGDSHGALDEARSLMREVPSARPAAALAWVAASLAGDEQARAEAIEAAAASLAPSYRATLYALAGELRISLGQDAEAKRLTELALRTDSNAPRVVWCQAVLALRTQDESLAASIEKAWSLFVPAGAHHQALATAFERAGDLAAAHAWTRRWFELRPWDSAVGARLVAAAVVLGRADDVEDALERMLASVHSWAEMAPAMAKGLGSLVSLSPARALAFAKLLLERGAAAIEPIREAMLDAARAADDASFEASVLEHALAVPGTSQDGAWLLRIAELRRRLGQGDAEANALARAASSREQAAAVRARLESATEATTGDAIVWRLEAQAGALEAQGEDTSRMAAGVWLRAGAARWDLGGDRNGALDAWRRAALILGDRTFARLGAALSRFAGDGAPAAIGAHAAAVQDVREASALLVVAAALALRAERPDVALHFAQQALERAPTRTDALLLIERASTKAGDADAIDKAYGLVAQAAKGRFGRRAAHYRAARALELRGFVELAIVHATAAFEADPVDGAVLALMLRIAEKLDPTDVIQTLVHVADREAADEAKAFWLRCAARLATSSVAHQRTALDLALKALLQNPCREAVEMLDVAVRTVIASHPDDTDIMQMRLARAARAITATLDGPRGARVAIDLAWLSIDALHAPSLAWTWLNAAFASSGDVDEYARLEGVASLLADERDAAGAFIDQVLERARGVGGTTGPALFALASSIAAAKGDQARQDALQAASQGKAAAEAEPRSVDVFGDLLDEAHEHEHEHEPEHEPQTAGQQAIADIDPVRRAANLETIGELEAASDVLEAEAGRDASRQPELDPHLRRLYAAAGRNTKLALVLERIAGRLADPAQRIRVLVELAALAEARGDIKGARAKWDQVGQLDPLHPDAAAFLEREAVDAGDYDRLAQLLGRRADATPDSADRKTLRLRRAMLFEHRLQRPDLAVQELEALLGETGEDLTVLRARAELAASAGDHTTAAQYWMRAAKASVAPSDAAAMACKAASVFLGNRHEHAAREALALAGPVRSPDVLALLVEIERLANRPVALAAALDELATASHAPDETRAQWLLDAAELGVASGQVDAAQERAARAERLAPDDAHLVLRRVQVDYRVAGLGNRAQVAGMLARLEAIAQRIPAADVGLHAFLSAEVIEALSGKEVAYRLLAERRQQAPTDPLIALGLAERLAAWGRPNDALPLFDVALAAGDLGVLRTRAQVAFAAARAALSAGGPVLAAPYVEEVQRYPEAAELAERLRREAAEPTQVTDEMRKQLERVARESSGIERAKALRQIARTWAAHGTRAAMAEADAYYAEALAAAGSDVVLRTQIETERGAFRDHKSTTERPPAPRSYPPPPAPPRTAPASRAEALEPVPTTPYPGTAKLAGFRESVPPATRSYPPPAAPASSSPPRPVRTPEPAGAASSASDDMQRRVSPPAPTPLAPAVAFGRASEMPPPRERSVSGPGYSFVEPRSPRPPRPVPSDSEEERQLFSQLAQGDLHAGDRLAELIERTGGRSHDQVAVRRRQVVLDPTNLRLLGALRDAALADHDRAHALAVEHVIDVLSGSPSPVQAPHAVAPDEPDRLHGMLSRGVHSDATEVFAHVWENASHVFTRDPAAFGVTGLERVVIGAPTPVGRAYALAARTLGLARVPIFHKRTSGPMTMAVAMLTAPAVVVTGEAREDSAELVYRLASMLVATLPANVMLFGMTGAAVKQLMAALMTAFGPPEASRGQQSQSAVLAGELWRALPGRAQRRMQQILRDSSFVYEEIWARALQSSRRAGLFVTADLRVALQDVMADPGVTERIESSSLPDMLRSLCQVSTSAADLVRFATSVQYAQARWRDDVPRRSLLGPGL